MFNSRRNFIVAVAASYALSAPATLLADDSGNCVRQFLDKIFRSSDNTVTRVDPPAVQSTAVTLPMAVLPNGEKLRPDFYSGGFHGSNIPPEEVIAKGGFEGPEKPNWNLYDHATEHLGADGNRDTAFRGTTQELSTMDGRGAADWAGDKGYVYDIGPVPTWDVNSALEGRVLKGGIIYKGNPWYGEHEFAIPRNIPLVCVKGWFMVVTNYRNKVLADKTTQTYIANKAYDRAACLLFFGR